MSDYVGNIFFVIKHGNCHDISFMLKMNVHTKCTRLPILRSPVPTDRHRYSVLQYAKDMIHRADSRLASRQWETPFRCNDVSRYLGANPESALSSHVSASSVLRCISSHGSVNPDIFDWRKIRRSDTNVLATLLWPLSSLIIHTEPYPSNNSHDDKRHLNNNVLTGLD